MFLFLASLLVFIEAIASAGKRQSMVLVLLPQGSSFCPVRFPRLHRLKPPRVLAKGAEKYVVLRDFDHGASGKRSQAAVTPD
jgi:hypothetical protein